MRQSAATKSATRSQKRALRSRLPCSDAARHTTPTHAETKLVATVVQSPMVSSDGS